MAEDTSNQERTEEATPERREEARERGDVVVSREVTGVFVLAATVAFISYYFVKLFQELQKLLVVHFEQVGFFRVSKENFHLFLLDAWREFMAFVIPVFMVTAAATSFITLVQSRFNWSWKKLEIDFSRIDPINGLAQMFSVQALVKLGISIAKMLVVGAVAYLVLRGEWKAIPALMRYPVQFAWGYWGAIIKTMFWSVAGLLMAIAAMDYLYRFMSMEGKLKMTKEDLKREVEDREIDQRIRAKMRRFAQEISLGKMLKDTKTATVVITNPTHFAVALYFDHLSMKAPIVVAKGKDFSALRIRETAIGHDVPIVENPPLARNLFKNAQVGKEIPEALYRAVAEVIRYVFKLKGKKIERRPSPVHDRN